METKPSDEVTDAAATVRNEAEGQGVVESRNEAEGQAVVESRNEAEGQALVEVEARNQAEGQELVVAAAAPADPNGQDPIGDFISKIFMTLRLDEMDRERREQFSPLLAMCDSVATELEEELKDPTSLAANGKTEEAVLEKLELVKATKKKLEDTLESVGHEMRRSVFGSGPSGAQEENTTDEVVGAGAVALVDTPREEQHYGELSGLRHGGILDFTKAMYEELIGAIMRDPSGQFTQDILRVGGEHMMQAGQLAAEGKDVAPYFENVMNKSLRDMEVLKAEMIAEAEAKGDSEAVEELRGNLNICSGILRGISNYSNENFDNMSLEDRDALRDGILGFTQAVTTPVSASVPALPPP